MLALVKPGGREAAGAVYAVLADGLCAGTLWLFVGTAVVAVVVSVSALRGLSAPRRRPFRRS